LFLEVASAPPILQGRKISVKNLPIIAFQQVQSGTGFVQTEKLIVALVTEPTSAYHECER